MGIRTVIRTVKIGDYLRGRDDKEVVLRFDPEDVIEVDCSCRYGAAGGIRNGNRTVTIVRKIEVLQTDGSWSPYPSVSWLDGMEGNDEALVTRAFVKKTMASFIS